MASPQKINMKMSFISDTLVTFHDKQRNNKDHSIRGHPHIRDTGHLQHFVEDCPINHADRCHYNVYCTKEGK